MISYTTGNILEANAKAIVNTVNCEGFMGKGIAYQFKLKYPENNNEYVKLCRNNQFKIGDIFVHYEDNKIILNFPTKDKWRNNSQYEYIEQGLSTLKEKILQNNIDSIAIPPLGCGNGGLKWEVVKTLIENSLQDISTKVEILIYEPVYSAKISYERNIKNAPRLSTSHLLLMNFKLNLTKLSKIRLQKAAYLNNIISGQDYFSFSAQNFGPYAHSIDILSRDIKEYQTYYNINTKEAYEKAKQVLISKNFNSKLDSFSSSLKTTIELINKIPDDSELELITTILFVVKEIKHSTGDSIINEIINWNDHKRKCFNSERIKDTVDYLLKIGLISKDLYGYIEINKYLAQSSRRLAAG